MPECDRRSEVEVVVMEGRKEGVNREEIPKSGM
jgi:hypothetical protein